MNNNGEDDKNNHRQDPTTLQPLLQFFVTGLHWQTSFERSG
jgi:hypothetical protein